MICRDLKLGVLACRVQRSFRAREQLNEVAQNYKDLLNELATVNDTDE